MADQNAPNSAADKDKSEGERWSPEQQGATRTPTDGDPSERYNPSGDEGGGITNRPLEEEIENQEAIPERGRTKGEEQPSQTNREGGQ